MLTDQELDWLHKEASWYYHGRWLGCDTKALIMKKNIQRVCKHR
jgi:hypothetical protein